MTELGHFLAQEHKEKEDMKSKEPGDNVNYLLFSSGAITIRVTRVLIEEATITSGFVLGHAANGKLGTSDLGGSIGAYSTVEEIDTEQELTNIGYDEIRDWLAGDSADYPTYMGIGTGTTAFDKDDDALETEVTRLAASTSTAAKKVTFTTVFGSHIYPHTITEVGLLNAASGGDLFNRRIITAYSKTSSKNMRITIDIEFDNEVPVMNACSNEIRDWLAGDSATAPAECAWGDGTTTIDITDTSMDSEQERNAIRKSTTAHKMVKFQSVLAASEADGIDVTRTALFNASSGGDMFIYDRCATIAKNTNFQIQTIQRIKLR